MKNIPIVEFQKNKKKETLEKVREYFRHNPFGSAADCADVVGVSYGTVLKRIKELREGA